MKLKILRNIKPLILLIIVLFIFGCSPKPVKSVKAKPAPPSRNELFDQYGFEFMSSFEEGKAIAVLNGESMLIDRTGHKIMDYPYDDEKPRFFEDYLIVYNGTQSKMINQQGEDILGATYDRMSCFCDCGYFRTSKNGKSGVLTLEDKTFHPIENLPLFLKVTSDGHLVIDSKKTNTTKLIDVDGKVIKEIPYQSVRSLRNGNFLAKQDGKEMLLDAQCDKVLSKSYDRIVDIEENYIVTETAKKRGLIDYNGNEIISPKYRHISENDGYYVFWDSIAFGIMDKEMNVLHRYESSCKYTYFFHPYLICSDDTITTAYNVETNSTQTHPYQISHLLSPFDGLIYKSGDKSGLVNDDLTIKNETSIYTKMLGMEVNKVGKNHVLLLPDGSRLNDREFSRVTGLSGINKLVLGHPETRKVGLFTREGQEVLPMEYDDIKHLYRNYLTVKKDGQFGIIKQNGETVFEPQFRKIEYRQGVYIVNKNYEESFLLDTNFEPMGLPNNKHVTKLLWYSNLFILGNDSIQVLYDTNTKSILEQGERMEQIISKHIQIQKDGKFGIMRLGTFEMVVPYQSEEYHMLKDGSNYSKVYFEIGNNPDRSGRGIAKLDGTELLPVDYGTTKWFDSKKELICLEKDGQVGIIDFDKNTVIPFLYEDIQKYPEGQYLVKKNKKYGVIDGQGEIIIPLKYKSVRSPSEGIIRVNQDGKWGYLYQNGEVMITPKYDQSEPFRSGLGLVKFEGKYGVINAKDEIVVPLIYESFRFRFKNQKVEKCWAWLEGEKLTLDLEGRCIENCPEALLSKYNIEKAEDK